MHASRCNWNVWSVPNCTLKHAFKTWGTLPGYQGLWCMHQSPLEPYMRYWGHNTRNARYDCLGDSLKFPKKFLNFFVIQKRLYFFSLTNTNFPHLVCFREKEKQFVGKMCKIPNCTFSFPFKLEKEKLLILEILLIL